MKANLVFHKAKNGDEMIFFHRPDGTTVEMTMHKDSIRETLARYVAEKCFRLKGAFRQILAGEDPMNLSISQEGQQAEAVARTIKDHVSTGLNPKSFQSYANLVCQLLEVPLPAFTVMDLNAAGDLIVSLQRQWDQLGRGQSIELQI